MSSDISMWQILVPTVRRADGVPIKTKFHRVWDAKVRAITGGLTIMTPAKGQWVSPSGELFVERMIPVNFAATSYQRTLIMAMTCMYYDQEAVLCFKISNDVSFMSAEEAKTYANRIRFASNESHQL